VPRAPRRLHGARRSFGRGGGRRDAARPHRYPRRHLGVAAAHDGDGGGALAAHVRAHDGPRRTRIRAHDTLAQDLREARAVAALPPAAASQPPGASRTRGVVPPAKAAGAEPAPARDHAAALQRLIRRARALRARWPEGTPESEEIGRILAELNLELTAEKTD